MFSFIDFYIFSNHFRDVVKHKVISKPHEPIKTEQVTSTVKRTLTFPPFQDIIDFDFKQPYFVKKLKRTGPSFLLMRVLQQFRETQLRDPNPKTRAEDLKKLAEIRDEIASETLPDSAFNHVFAQVSPAAAIVGGELAQEIIKTVSQKEAPHNNVFLFDPDSCCGFIETIS